MRGINYVMLAGNVCDDALYRETGSGAPCATFRLACDRRGMKIGEVVTAFIKINVYSQALVGICQERLRKGGYVIVVGELMNRDERMEVRAREVVFTDA